MSKEESFILLVKKVLFEDPESPPKDDEIAAIIVTYKLYTNIDNLLSVIREEKENNKSLEVISNVLSKWARMEHNRHLISAILEILPGIVSNNSLNAIKLSILNRSQSLLRERPQALRSSSMETLFKQHLFQYQKTLIAQALTMIDWNSFSKIKFQCFLNGAWQKKDRKNLSPYLTALAERFDTVSFWVATQILTPNTLEKQVKILTHFILLMKKLLKLRNHQGTQQILSGLNLAAIQRLKTLWGSIPFKIREAFDEIDELFSPIGNVAKYRELVEQVEKENQACLPYVAVYLRDIIHAEEAEEFTETGEINFERLKSLSQNILRLTKFQHIPYRYDVPSELHRYLQFTHENILTADELWDLSVERQPIQSDSQLADSAGIPQLDEVDLQAILDEPLLCNGLRKYLTLVGGAEHLSFLRDFNRFVNQNPSHKPKHRKNQQMQDIVKLYLDPKSALFVNLLTAEERAEIQSLAEAGKGPQIFEALRRAAYDSISTKLPGYLADPLYKSCKNIHNRIKATSAPEKLEFNITQFSRSDWNQLISEAKELHLPDGTILVQQNTISNHIYLLESGVVYFIQEFFDGSNHILGKVDTPTMLGELNLFETEPSKSSIVVKEGQAHVYCIDTEKLKSRILRQLDFGLRFYLHTGQHMAFSLEKLNAIKRTKRNMRASICHSDLVGSPKKLDYGEIIAMYECKLVGVVARNIKLVITQQAVCLHSKIFGQRLREAALYNEIRLTKFQDRYCIILTYKTKRRKILLSAQDYNLCVQQLEVRIAAGVDTIRAHRLSSSDFIELTDTDWDLIFSAEKSANLRFSKDDVIIEQGLRYGMVCQISSGSVRVEKRGTDGLITLAVLQVGAVFGEITFLTGGVASASVIADDNVELFIIHKSSLQTLFTNHRDTVVKFYHHLCETLAHRISDHEKYFYQNGISYAGETSLGIPMPSINK